MKTENRDVTISLNQLRDAALEMNDKLRGSALAKLPRDHLALVHAYQLGVVMRAVGLAAESIPAMFQFVELGYNDFGVMKAADEAGGHG